jgi:hypothetical protein
MLRKILKAKVLLPWNNLGCLGFSCGSFYMDFFLRPQFGCFINNGRSKRWYRLPSCRLTRKEG